MSTREIMLFNMFGRETPPSVIGDWLESVEATGLAKNKDAAKTGGRIAKKARLDLEEKTGRKVVTGENYLPPPKDAKKIR